MRLRLRSCPCSRGSRPRSRSAFSSPTPAGASCSRPTSPRPRLPCLESATWWTQVSRASSATATGARSNSGAWRTFPGPRRSRAQAAALSVQDPRQRPGERPAAADEAQKQFNDEKSDFLSWIKLWEFFDEALEHRKPSRKLHQSCREHFLSFNRMREWRDIHRQLKELVVELGWRVSETPATYEQVHRALLAGLLGNVGTKTEEGNYLGARGIRFWIHPGS